MNAVPYERIENFSGRRPVTAGIESWQGRSPPSFFSFLFSPFRDRRKMVERLGQSFQSLPRTEKRTGGSCHLPLADPRKVADFAALVQSPIL